MAQMTHPKHVMAVVGGDSRGVSGSHVGELRRKVANIHIVFDCRFEGGRYGSAGYLVPV